MLSVLYGLTESLNSLTLEEADGGIVTILNIAGHCTWGNRATWESLVKVLVTQLCPTLCSPMDFDPPGSSVHEEVWYPQLDVLIAKW